MKAIGLMSVTSLDGVDVALCEINGYGENTELELLDFATYPMPAEIETAVRQSILNELSISQLTSLNFQLGAWFADSVQKMCQNNQIQSSDLAFIASHGQTIYHQATPSDDLVASTLQLGEAAVIAYQCQCHVVSNFRVMDMAANGQGAPLVPYSEYILYRQKDRTVALQNLGGIGNMTIIAANASLDDLIAFDTGPANMMINDAMKRLYDKAYDANGEIGSHGKIVRHLQEELMNHPYLKLGIPKTTGREDFGQDFTEALLNKYSSEKPEDVIHTLTWFSAYCIADGLKHTTAIDELILAGGGVHNETLVSFIKELLPEITVFRQEDYGYSSDAKEAIAFVILGNQTLHFQASNVPKATGANRQLVLGQITLRPF